MKNILIFYMATALLLASCTFTKGGGKVLSPEEYTQKVRSVMETEYKFKSATDSFDYTLQFIPQEVLFLNHHQGKPSQKDVDSFNKHRQELLSFVLTIAPVKNYKYGVAKSYEALVCANEKKMDYLAQGMQNAIALVNGSDSLAPVFYHFERSFGLKPYMTFHLGFRNPGRWEKDIVLKIYNQLTSKEQLCKFTIPSNIITESPSLKM